MKPDYTIVSFSGGKDSTARFMREDKAKRDQRTLDVFGGLA